MAEIIAYYQITNEETNEVDIGDGTDETYYKSIGMTKGKVEQSYDKKWYLSGFAPAPDVEFVKTEYTAKIQSRLDIWAQEKDFDGIIDACSYPQSTNSEWRAESFTAIAFRDATWLKRDEIFAEMDETGVIPTWEEVEDKLPALSWSMENV